MSEPAKKSLLLHNVRAVLPDRTLERGAIFIENERVATVSTSAPTRNNAQQIDLQGLTLFPGFIDVHIRGAVGVDMMAASAADVGRVSQFLATCGVTGWLPTLVPAAAADYARAIKSINEATNPTIVGARILGVHYEGPFVNS